ncbi:MAG: hypothetical protein ACSHYB_19575 [Roseibacillus sp.]
MKLLPFLVAYFLSCSISSSKVQETEIPAVVRAEAMVEAFKRGELRPGFNIRGVRADVDPNGSGPIVGSGPKVLVEPLVAKSDDARSARRWVDVLRMNGRDLAELGDGVFPLAYALLDHPHAYLRIIGASALAELSGRNPVWFNASPPWDETGNQLEWATKAKIEWASWHSKKLESASR